MIQLGVMKKIEDLRSVWTHEALEFTPWLAKPENMKLLSETIGLDIEVEETESSVDSFSADIVGIDTNTGRKVINDKVKTIVEKDGYRQHARNITPQEYEKYKKFFKGGKVICKEIP